MNITCMDCGKVLGTVEFKQAISREEVLARANCYRCGDCAEATQIAAAKLVEEAIAAEAKLLADVDKAATVEQLRAVVKTLITKGGTK